MGERARGGCTESSPSQWGPSNWARVGEAPQLAPAQQHSTVAPLPAQCGGPPGHHTHVGGTWDVCLGSSARECQAQPVPKGAHSSSVRMPAVAQPAAEQARAECHPAASMQASLARCRFSICALVNQQQPEKTTAARPATGLGPMRHVPRVHQQRCWGTQCLGGHPRPQVLLCSSSPLGHCMDLRLLCDVLLAVPAPRNSPLLAGIEECKQRNSCCSCGRSPPCSRRCGELGSKVSLQQQGALLPPPPSPAWGRVLPRSPGLPCCWFLLQQRPSPAVLPLLGKPGWQQCGGGGAWFHTTCCLLCLAARGQGCCSAGQMEGGLSPTAARERMGNAAKTLTDAFRNLKPCRSPLRPIPREPQGWG